MVNNDEYLSKSSRTKCKVDLFIQVLWEDKIKQFKDNTAIVNSKVNLGLR